MNRVPYTSTPSGKKPKNMSACLITAQGELMCSTNTKRANDLKRELAGFGDQDTVDRMRSTIGTKDPYNLMTVDRYISGPVEQRNKNSPCCKKDCMYVGSCRNPVEAVKHPESMCAMCGSNRCDGTC